ncbi:hypothetical protein Gorai_013161 [Gossypium raimondii]|uniref:DUF4283 domain-containing protein n=1 Tax=Gossypium raimondii TaxID=29730 RepID=A0A7J8Q4X1_GOSRA|nr:hypothetical protein [Gossypium raimondii]
MEDYMASLSLQEVEEDFIQLGAESVDNGISYANCFVGMFLTSIVVHFQAMISILANVWHPIGGGVSISDLENGRFLFQFYFEVERNDPWNFNSHLLVLHRLVQGENPLTVQLTEVNFWILVNDIPHGFTSKGKSNTSILTGPIARSGLGHSVNIVNGSFDDEMVIREEENSPMYNLDRLNRPRTLSFASGVSVNKDSIKVLAILMQSLNDCPQIHWVVIGDFNKIACMLEKWGSLVSGSLRRRGTPLLMISMNGSIGLLLMMNGGVANADAILNGVDNYITKSMNADLCKCELGKKEECLSNFESSFEQQSREIPWVTVDSGIFSNDEVKKIGRIPIPLCYQPDKLVWSGEKSGSFSGCRFNFTKRKCNSVAHALAKKGLMTLEVCFSVEDASMEAKELADADRRFQQPS